MEMWAWDNETDGLRLIFVVTIIAVFMVGGLMMLSDFIKSKRKPKYWYATMESCTGSTPTSTIVKASNNWTKKMVKEELQRQIHARWPSNSEWNKVGEIYRIKMHSFFKRKIYYTEELHPHFDYCFV